MNKTTYTILVACLLFIMTSCKEKSTAAEPEQNAQNNTTLTYPPLPLVDYRNIVEQVDYIDYIFHTLPFAVSQEDKPSITTKLSGILIEEANIIDCPPLGRMMLHADGEIIYEAEVYYDGNGCNYYIFYIDNKPTYSAGMSNYTRTFYQNLLNSAAQQ